MKVNSILNKIILFATNHTNTLGLVRSLGEKDIHVHCVLVGEDSSGLVYDSKYPASVVMFPNYEDCLNHILKIYSKEQLKPIILSSGDEISTFIDKHADVLKDKFFIENAGEQGRHTELMDKSVIGQLAKECGLIIPQSLLLSIDSPKIDQVHYPCFTKTSSSVDILESKRFERVCYNKSELLDVLTSFGGKLLVQDYIDKKTEYCLQGYSANGQIFFPYVMMYLRFSKNEYGGYVKMFRLRNEDLIAKCRRLIQKCNYTGLFSIEFIVDKNDNLFFTEVNLRNDGYAYFTTSGGANLPYLYCCALVNKPVDVTKLTLKESYKAIYEGYDYIQSVKNGDVSLFKFFWNVLSCKSFIVLNRKDFNVAVQKVLKRFRK